MRRPGPGRRSPIKERSTNAAVTAEWFATVQAPQKRLVWFEHSGSIP